MGFKDNPIVFLTRYAWKYSVNRKQFVLFWVLSIIANLIDFIEPLVVAKILNTIQERGVTQDNIYSILGLTTLFILITIGFWTLHGPSRVLERRNAFFTAANYKKYLLEGTMRLPLQWHVDHHSGDTIDKIERGTSSLNRYADEMFAIISIIIKVISSFVALAYFYLPGAFIAIFLGIIGFSIMLQYDKLLRNQYKQINLMRNEISAKVYDVISNITTVIILSLQDLLGKEIWKKILKPYPVMNKNNKINELKWFIVSLFTAIFVTTILASYIYSQYKVGATILVGTVYALYSYTQRINDVYFHLAWRYGDFVKEKTSIENAEELSREFKEQTNIEKVHLTNKWGVIRVKNLNFSYYRKKEELHLNNINLEFKKNQKIALIGESGSGKTTFMKLIRGIYKPNHIELFVDDIPIKEGFETLSDNITLIPQEPEIFATTIEHNITMGVQHTVKHIRRFTDIAHYTNVFERFPKKLKSSVVERGVNMSVGEKQRLALTRGLLAGEDKQFILFDEPTSSVDTKTELKIYKEIMKDCKNKTLIVSVHRLHLLGMFDKIYIFKKGKIIASGSLKELLKKSSEFKRLWKRYHYTKNIKIYKS